MKFKIGDEVIYPETKQEGKVIDVDKTHVRVHWDGDLLPQWSPFERVEITIIYNSPLAKYLRE